jgi:hypothetical protein
LALIIFQDRAAKRGLGLGINNFRK